MRYAPVVGATWLSPISFELSAAGRDNFRPILKDACQSTARRLGLTPPFITQGVADMVREIRFATSKYTSLTAGVSTFLFVDQTAAVAKKLRSKSRLWDNALMGKRSPLNGRVLPAAVHLH